MQAGDPCFSDWPRADPGSRPRRLAMHQQVYALTTGTFHSLAFKVSGLQGFGDFRLAHSHLARTAHLRQPVGKVWRCGLCLPCNCRRFRRLLCYANSGIQHQPSPQRTNVDERDESWSRSALSSPLRPSYLGKISGSWSKFPTSTRLALELERRSFLLRCCERERERERKREREREIVYLYIC